MIPTGTTTQAAPMGRRKTINKDLPPRLFRRAGRRRDTYYYTGVRPAINLGHDRAEALRQWAELESRGELAPLTLADIAKRYTAIYVPTMAPRTQRDTDAELKRLLPVFGAMRPEDIRPHHVQTYLDRRTALVRANREKARLSHLFNWARARGYTDVPNPCAGIRGHRERGRDRYVEDAEYLAVWQAADPILRDAMDLALYTGQRPGDLLRMQRSDIRDGVLHVRQGKTGTALRLRVDGALAEIIDRALSRQRSAISHYLLADDRGQRITYDQLDRRFRSARKAAGVQFQFRDLRAKNASDTPTVEEARARLGHTTTSMTDRYRRRHRGDLVAALATNPALADKKNK